MGVTTLSQEARVVGKSAKSFRKGRYRRRKVTTHRRGTSDRQSLFCPDAGRRHRTRLRICLRQGGLIRWLMTRSGINPDGPILMGLAASGLRFLALGTLPAARNAEHDPKKGDREKAARKDRGLGESVLQAEHQTQVES
jgi:hypothetical protein